MEVIEPSEILIDADGTIKPPPVKVNPWSRFLARMFDYSLLLWVIVWLSNSFQWDFSLSFIPVEYFTWIPLETLLLWGLKTTPGKWFLRIKLKQGQKERLQIKTALRRSLAVWFRGIGLGIPFLNAICMAIAYQKLKLLQTTTWDRDEYIQITHLPIGQWRLVVAAIFTAVTFSYYFYP